MNPMVDVSHSTDKVPNPLPFHYISFDPDVLADIRSFTPHSWRDLIGVVPQDPVLFNGTIATNIAFGNESATRSEIEEAARLANCEFIWGMPHGFDTEGQFLSRKIPSVIG